MTFDLKGIATQNKSSIMLYVVMVVSICISLWCLRQVVELSDNNEILARAILDIQVTTLSNDDILSKKLPDLASAIDKINTANSIISALTAQNKKLQDDLVAQYIIISQRIDEGLPNYVKQ